MNPSKTEAAFFTRRRCQRAFPKQPIKIGRLQTDWNNSAKYLGIHLDKTLTFKLHTEKAIEKAGKCTRALYSLLSRSSKLHPNNKLLLSKSIIRPTMLNGSPVWSVCAATHLQRIQVFQNRCLKMCLGLHYRHPTNDVHKLAVIEPIAHYTTRLRSRFELMSGTSPNPLIAELHYCTPSSSSPSSLSKFIFL